MGAEAAKPQAAATSPTPQAASLTPHAPCPKPQAPRPEPQAFCVTLSNVTSRNTHGRALTALQQAILDVLWARGAVTAETVREALAPAHQLKDSTVRTLLRRLEARKLVTHTVDG